MNVQQHTPGPWRVEQDTTLVWGGCNPDDSSSRGMGYPIAEARITPSSGWTNRPWADEGEANAHLIALAPEMLAALLAWKAAADLGDAFEAEGDSDGPEDAFLAAHERFTEASDEAERLIVAVLAKAEGSS